MMSNPQKYGFLRSRLARKQLFLILIFSSIITLIGTFIQLLIEYRSETRHVESQLSQIGSSHLESLTNSLWAFDDRQIEIQLNNILSLRDIVYIEIVESGTVIASAGNNAPTNLLVHSFPMVFYKNQTAREIGVLNVHATVAGVYQRMYRRLFVILVTQGLKTFIVSLIILYIIHRQVTQYLIKISNYAHKLSLDRLDQKLDFTRKNNHSPDELDQLTDAIDGMRCRLLEDVSYQNQQADVLRESEALMRTVAENYPHSYLLIIEHDRTISFASGPEFRRQGFNASRLIGRPIGRVFLEHTDLVSEKISQSFKGHQAEFELFFNSQHQLYRTVPLGGMDDGVKNILLVIENITERKTAEEALRRYEQIISSTSDLMSFVDRHYVYQAVNSAYLKAHAKRREQIVGVSVEELMGPEKFKLIAKGSLDRALRGESVQYQSWFDYAGIGRRFMDVKYHPFKDHSGDVTGVVASVHDLTERKQAEEAMSFFFDQSLVMLFVADIEDKKLIRINNEVCRVTGSTEADLIATPMIEYIHPEDRKYTLAALAHLSNGQPLVGFQNRYLTSAGDIRIFEWNAVADKDRNRVYAMAKDITDQKNTEMEHEKLQEELLQARKMESIGQLAGGVAHDFNNMLSIIIGHTEMMLEDIGEKHYLVTKLNEILHAAERSADLTRQLLAFARKQTIAPIVLNLNDTLEGILKMLRRLIGEEIELTWHPEENLWPVKIDPSQVDQLLANLCVNARDSINGVGKVTIETCNISFDAEYCQNQEGFMPGEYIMIAVSDTGCGIEKENIDKLFEPFYTTKNIGQGTGLGLSTVYGIVKQNNGFINVYSEPGEGTTFKIYLSRHGGKTIREQIHDDASVTASGGETILLVEDEEPILAMAEMMLTRLGYKTICASRPGEALKIAESFPDAIDLLLTDVVMPEMSGRDLAERLSTVYPGIKCLYMSGYPANVIVHHGVLDEDVQFINKPFTNQALSAMVRQVLDGASDAPS